MFLPELQVRWVKMEQDGLVCNFPNSYESTVAKYLHAFVAILINGVAVKHMGR